MTKVRFSKGWDDRKSRYKWQTGVVLNWLLDGVVEVKADKTGTIYRLYASEYREI